jgi:protein disulfide-isomerase A3
MKYFLILLIAVAAVAAVSGDGDVIILKDSDFESKIRQHEVALVKFYAPWCGHCKRMAPEFDAASTILKENDPPVALIKVDCTTETETCQKYGVSGYPTLKIFKNGELSGDYNGPRETDGIVKQMRTKAGPISKKLTTIEEVEKFLKNNEHSIIGFFKEENSLLFSRFKQAADKLAEHYRFAHSSNGDVLAKYGKEE